MAGEFALFVWGITWNEAKSPWISKNDGIDGTGISLFLHPVYFIQFSMSQMKERAKFMPKKLSFRTVCGGERMKKVCLTVLCILLVGCGNAETAETEENAV